LSGVAPVAAANHSLAVPAGSLTLSGSTPSQPPGALIITPSVGTLTLAGTGSGVSITGGIPSGAIVFFGRPPIAAVGSSFNPAWVDATEIVSYLGDSE
jgi:hypothetical protein